MAPKEQSTKSHRESTPIRKVEYKDRVKEYDLRRFMPRPERKPRRTR